MSALSSGSQLTLYILLALMGLFALLTFGWQIMVLRGKAMKNTDGSYDDWHEQKIFYGMALADVILACPACRRTVEPEGEEGLACVGCGRVYPVRDGIPVMLVEQATSPTVTDT